MRERGIAFKKEQFNRLFPFYILIDEHLRVDSYGRTLEKLCPGSCHELFSHRFTVTRPEIPRQDFTAIRSICNQLVIIEVANPQRTVLRGQFEYLENERQLLFIGSPWFGSMEQVKESRLTLDDFAYHDPLIDLLHVLKTREITNDDLKELLITVNSQKAALKKAADEVRSIALLPMQNPDPILRISEGGTILMKNPAAEELKDFHYEHTNYTAEEFWKTVARRIDKTQERWIFEAVSDQKVFSFVCRYLPEQKYFNVYGQNITRQKKNEQELQRLSLVASANENGVLFTQPDGRITWANEGFCKLTGYTYHEIIGKTPVELCRGPLTNEEALQKAVDAFQKGLVFNTEIVYYHKDGSWFWGRSTAQPIKNEQGDITEYFGIIEDITLEKEQKERLKVLSQIAEDNINAVVIADREGRVNWVNKSFTRMTGYTLEEAMGRKPGHLLQGPETDSKTVDYLRRQISNGEPFSTEILNYRKGGTKYWLRIQGQPVRNEAGELTGFFALEEDVTKEKESELERKDAEERLERQRKFYEDILNNMPADIAVFSPRHEYLFVNPRGIRDEELRKWIIGKKDEDYCTYRNRPLDLAAERRKRFNHVIESKTPDEWEEKIIATDGKEHYMLRRWFPVLDKNNEVTLVIGYGLDITERKKIEQALKANEEKYRGIIANMNLGLMEMDLNHRLVYANQSFLEMSGLSAEQVGGYDTTQLLTDESLGIVAQKAQNRKKGISEAYEIQVKVHDTLRWWLVSSAPRFNDAGAFMGSIVICLDITDRKELEKQLIASREQAEQLAKAKEVFLANMSHEIRTPMNAIMGMSNQLAKTHLSSQQRFYLDTIHSAADNLLVIINDILDLSKIEAGKLSLERIGFEPTKVVAHALQVFAHKAEEKGIRLVNSYCDPQLSPVLIGDPYRLNQVLLNLISNAIKFTESGTVDVTCRVIGDTPSQQAVEVRVIDTGIGMKASFVHKLFEKFTQENETVSRNAGGTGLGMSICKELVELMGGKIEVYSKRGVGTTVLFTIRFAKGQTADLPQKTTPLITGDFLQGRKILVTDDNDLNRLVATTILQNYGAETLEAANGVEALAVLSQSKPDLILMDIQMPVLNGLEATRRIRSSGIPTPVIALTANAIKGESDKCLAAGMNDYITKPFVEEEFLKIIAGWLNTEVPGHKEPEKAEEEPLYDLSSLKAISHGNTAFVEKMIHLFCEQAPVMIRQMQEAFSTRDVSKMSSLAHQLKPTIDMLHIKSLAEDIRVIEKSGKGQSVTPDLAPLLMKAESTVSKILSLLSQEYPHKDISIEDASKA